MGCDRCCNSNSRCSHVYPNEELIIYDEDTPESYAYRANELFRISSRISSLRVDRLLSLNKKDFDYAQELMDEVAEMLRGLKKAKGYYDQMALVVMLDVSLDAAESIIGEKT